MDDFEDHNILELLLFYSIPQKDTNPIAHALLDAFGSLSNVLDAPYEELVKVKGISENSASLLKLIAPLSRAYLDDKYKNGHVINSTEQAGEFLLPKFIGRTNEAAYLLSLDNKSKVINCSKIIEGNVNAVAISIRKIVELALKDNATACIVAHNHPLGLAIPSNDDIDTTLKIKEVLETLNIQLLDHIIVAEDDFVSLADSGAFDPSFTGF